MQYKSNEEIREIGYITSYFAGVGKIKGLPNVCLYEVLLDENNNEAAFVIGFNEKSVEAIFLNDTPDIHSPLFRSKKLFSIPFTEDFIGRIVDGTGKPIDGLGPIRGKEISVFRNAPQIIDRQPVRTPIETGIKIIDATLPIGRGQRELIIGDRKLGKSTIAVDTVLNQKDADPPVYCIYVVCGQKRQQLDRILEIFKEQDAMEYSTIVAATAGDTIASQYLAPFIGCTIAEYFRDNGKDALVVYDDLSKHAKTYRTISLLLERAPGREAYPGDIFSLHAGLLERPAKLSNKKGGGSLTALPIIETQEGDISSYISTNLISITDGQIYLERDLFQRNFIPAVNVGLSVSRIGSQVQPKALKEVTGGIRLALSQHKELQKLAQLETKVSQGAQNQIHRGNMTLELLKQNKHEKISWEMQVVLFDAIQQGYFDDIEPEKWTSAEKLLIRLIKNRYPDILIQIKKGDFNNKIKKEIQEIIEDFKKEYNLKKEDEELS